MPYHLCLDLLKCLLSGYSLLGPSLDTGLHVVEGQDTCVCFSQQCQWGPNLLSPGTKNEYKEVSRWFQDEAPGIVEQKYTIFSSPWPKPWPTKSISITRCLCNTTSLGVLCCVTIDITRSSYLSDSFVML